ncbi:glycine zipper 2TM domain-containing protein [Novosphingobium sp.]|uniref:glycine zipper 2TM domain-containing protein n=1 Tax=Novosphingobium sp. TaxID=1874826 RepID=UPI0026232521|nr:glycine zipper 2TM domain-containing protein [Novosphingobium sp.]
MRARMLLLALLSSGLAATPALAHDRGGAQVQTYPGHWGGPFGMWYGGWQPQMVVNVPNPPPAPPAQWQGGYDGQNLDRETWLRECRRRLGDNGVGGAVIGGVLGGVAGNVIGGRGNRVLGTVAGAAVGAVAGAAIDKAEDKGRVQDRCEAMLTSPVPPGYAPGPQGAAYGYAMPMMWVPVMMVPVGAAQMSGQASAQGSGQKRVETVVTEEVRYVTVPRRHRIITHRTAPDKRIRIAPDKRVPQ